MTYRVRIQGSEHAFDVHEGESVIDAALRNGLMLPYSCRSGSCGTCRGRVVAGAVGYPNGYPPALEATEAEAGDALFCQARPESDLVIAVREVREAGDIIPRKLPARVTGIEDLAPDVRRLWLRLPAGTRLAFLAGQYLDILLRGGRRRSFSLANAPHDDERLELHVRHLPGGAFSGHVFEGMREGALLRFEGPLGNFYLRDESPRPMIMVAGGTGFAPIKGIIEHALYIGVTRPVHLYRGARARQDLYLDALPQRWAAAHDHVHYTPVLSEPQGADDWQGATGFVHGQVLADHPDLSGFDVYMSGPPPMIEAAKRDFASAGLDPSRLFYDSFEQARE